MNKAEIIIYGFIAILALIGLLMLPLSKQSTFPQYNKTYMCVDVDQTNVSNLNLTNVTTYEVLFHGNICNMPTQPAS